MPRQAGTPGTRSLSIKSESIPPCYLYLVQHSQVVVQAARDALPWHWARLRAVLALAVWPSPHSLGQSQVKTLLL